MDSRIRPRKKMRMAVRFGEQRPERLGFIVDVSPSGLYIETNRVLPIGSPISLDVELRNGSHLALRGRVMRSKPVPATLAQVMRGGMGVRLDSPPPDWIDAIAMPEEADPPSSS
jgi:Tfp pilus assembly protein PilZ